MKLLRTLKAIRNSTILRFEGVTDALWYGVVNIESAEVRIGVKIPQSGEVLAEPDFRILTGDGDGDYPVFLLDEEAWLKDPDEMRPGWGVCIPFYRNFADKARETLLQHYEDRLELSSYRLGYLVDQQEQLNCGSAVTYVGDFMVTDHVYVSDSLAHVGGDFAIVDVPLRPGKYCIFLIEGSSRDQSIDAYRESSQDSDDLVVRSLILIHSEKVGATSQREFPKDPLKVQSIYERLRDREVSGKVNPGPRSENAVGRSFWVAVWGLRSRHALSWNIQGLTFPDEYSEPFREYFASAGAVSEQDIDWTIKNRGLDPEVVRSALGR